MKEVRQRAERHEESIRNIEEFDPNWGAEIRTWEQEISDENRRRRAILREIEHTRARANHMITRHVEEQIRNGR